MSKVYVGLTGRAGAGKDYVADKIIEELEINHDYWAEKVPWAFGVRQEIEDVLDTPIDILYAKPTPYEIRRLLQWWGTDFRRAQDPDYWVNIGMESARDRHADVILFPDTRFENEVDAIQRAGGIIINVAAAPRIIEDRIGKVPGHASEDLADSLPYDIRLWNNGVDESHHLIEHAVKLILDRKRGIR